MLGDNIPISNKFSSALLLFHSSRLGRVSAIDSRPWIQFPAIQSQIQTNSSSAPFPQQVMMQNNPFQVNPALGQMHIQQQQQQQMGMMNPPHNQIVGNGSVTIPNRPPFMNLPNQFVPMQNAMMRPSGHFLGPQNPNPISMSSSQPGGGGQFVAHNSMNHVPYNTQNFMLPNGQFYNPMNPFILPNGGQFCQQNPTQNMVQFAQMQTPNFAQVIPGNMQLFQNQVSLGMPPQNPNFPGIQQFGVPQSSGIVQHNNQDQQKLVSPVMNMTTTNTSSSTGPQLQVNSSMQQSFASVQPQQDQSFGPPGFTRPQGNFGKSNGVNNVSIKGNISRSKNFTRHPKNDASQRGFKPQFPHKQNGQGKNRFNHQHGNKGYNNDGSTKSDDTNSTNSTRAEKKPLPLNYTEQEIQQWREARKKNFPTKANVEKMVGEKKMLQDVKDRDDKLRRQQLKEILAKQAELGCEVAEIPPSYLSDSEQGRGNEGNRREWGKKGRFRNKFNKRGRSHQDEKFTKKQKSENHDRSDTNNDENGMKQQVSNRDHHKTKPSKNKKEPTLLQKLLAADLSRDKSHLLQVFRFMVVNSFFKDCPEKPLRFPLIIIKENGAEGEVPVENSINDDDVADDKGEPNEQCEGGKGFRAEESSGEKKVVGPEEEEGEIID